MAESDEHPWTFKNKPKPAAAPRKGGYTKPDRTVRCKKCGVGKHPETGEMVGTPIAAYTLSCGMPEGGSVVVARFARCYKCKTLSGMFVLTEKGRDLGIEFFKASTLLKQSNGTWFSLEELKTGKIKRAESYPGQGQDLVAKIVREEAIDTEQHVNADEQEMIF